MLPKKKINLEKYLFCGLKILFIALGFRFKIFYLFTYMYSYFISLFCQYI